MNFFEFKTARTAARSILLLALLAYGLIGSLKIVFHYFGIDPDTSHSLMLWQGIREHGIAWITDWRFTQDNWLLTVIPLDFAGFAVFGADAHVALVIGWLIFVANAIVAGLLTARLGAPRAAPFVVVAVLNCNVYAHIYGFVSYSTSHNTTNLCGLLSLLALTSWVVRPRPLYLAIVLVLLTAGAVSDPWMLPAWNLPIALAGLLSVARPTAPVTRSASLWLVAVAAFSIVATKTKLFGLFDFLPHVDYALASWPVIQHNLAFLIRDMGALLNLVPTTTMAAFSSGALSLTVITVFLLWQAARPSVRRTPMPSLTPLLAATVVLSVGGIAGAFVFSSVEAALLSGRFLINGFFLVVIAVAVLSEIGVHRRDVVDAVAKAESTSRGARLAVCALFALFMLANIVSSARIVPTARFEYAHNGADDLITFLKSRGLTYGYGPYWGSFANAVTTVSNEQVIVRPVFFDPASGRMITTNRSQSSKRWYENDDVPAGTRRVFVIVMADGEVCSNVARCVSALKQQFGVPAETIQHDAMTILVWNHRLLHADPPGLPVELGKTYFFGNGGTFLNGEGWSGSEAWGTWSDGAQADLFLAFDPTMAGRDVEMTIDSRCYLFGTVVSREITVMANAVTLGRLPCSPSDAYGVRRLTIPAAAFEGKGGDVDLRFLVKDPKSPHELGGPNDTRKIGVGLTSLTFR